MQASPQIRPFLPFFPCYNLLVKRSLLLLCLLPFLISCSSGLDFSSYEYGTLNEEPFSSKEGDGYKEIAEFSPISSQDESFLSYSSLLEKEDEKGKRRYAMPSTGVAKLLVIPVDFEDYPSSLLPSDSLARVNRAFFGKSSSSFYSVASYYEESSYSRLQIRGKVASSWFRAKQESTAYESTSLSVQKSSLSYIYKEALSWYDSTYPEDPSSNYAYTSGNGESVVPVFFVYSRPYEGMDTGTSSRSSFFWAFSMDSPAPIAFASYYMMDDQATSRTYVHEMGHLLGLKDYYDENAKEDVAEISPLGRADMMDASLGDHNPFSKALLDWTRPTYVTSSCEITLSSFSSSGQFLLLSPNWNGSIYDEYFLVCFYSPFGINSHDGKRGNNLTSALPYKPGVMVYHVDARLEVYKNNLHTYSYLPDSGVSTSGFKVDFAFDNSIGNVGSTSKCLIQLMDASSNSSSLSPYFVASSLTKQEGKVNYRDVLFQKGQKLSSLGDLSFHKGGSLNLDFEVKEVASTYAMLSFKTIG